MIKINYEKQNSGNYQLRVYEFSGSPKGEICKCVKLNDSWSENYFYIERGKKHTLIVSYFIVSFNNYGCIKVSFSLIRIGSNNFFVIFCLMITCGWACLKEPKRVTYGGGMS